MTSILLSPKDIFEQEFKRSMRGYDPKDVDAFLDDVIKDYETFAAQIDSLKKENERLREELKKEKTKATPVVAEPTMATPAPAYSHATTPSDVVKPSSAVTNFDILKRISRLEREVFGKQIVE